MEGMDGIRDPNGWRDRLESLVGRRIDTWVVAAIVGVVVLGSLLIWKRNAPAEIAPPAQLPPDAVSASTSSPAPVLVHVAGAVRRSGLYELTEAARVADAIESAGGALGKADLDALNLASPVTDGMQVLVPVRGEVASPSSASASSQDPAMISVNSADQIALETIPGIGPVTAAAIIEHRERVGPFSSVDELIDVSGIGPATLEAIRPYVTV
jgi:competence protein ComEA